MGLALATAVEAFVAPATRREHSVAYLFGIASSHGVAHSRFCPATGVAGSEEFSVLSVPMGEAFHSIFHHVIWGAQRAKAQIVDVNTVLLLAVHANSAALSLRVRCEHNALLAIQRRSACQPVDLNSLVQEA